MLRHEYADNDALIKHKNYKGNSLNCLHLLTLYLYFLNKHPIDTHVFTCTSFNPLVTNLGTPTPQTNIQNSKLRILIKFPPQTLHSNFATPSNTEVFQPPRSPANLPETGEPLATPLVRLSRRNSELILLY